MTLKTSTTKRKVAGAIEPVKKGPGGWRDGVDMDEFKAEIDALGKKLREGQGEEDTNHLAKMMMWQRTAFWSGFIGACFLPLNPICIFLVSVGTCMRWTMVAHHICHGGYDKCSKYNRRTFAIGLYRRCIDWLDWMLPEAWNVEHNQYHHYQLGEVGDPDLLEENVKTLRDWDIAMPIKYMAVLFFMLTWKWYYYAPNTLKELKLAQSGGSVKAPDTAFSADGRPKAMTISSVFYYHSMYGVELFTRVLLPYFMWTFVLLPLPALYLGVGAYKNVVLTMIFAEMLTNIHAFVIVVTNHAGDDIYRFNSKCYPKSADFYLRQIVGSVNFTTGGNVNDFLHGWLNYQIEHHIWPDLSMVSYQKSQPLVKALCKKYGIPYLQENVFVRFKKTVDVMVGKTSMKRWELDA